MRTIEIKAYKFAELSEEAKDKAISNYLSERFEYSWMHENIQSLEAFAEAFDIIIRSYSFPGRGSHIRFTSRLDDEALELTGTRLLSYVYNNYNQYIAGRRYLKTGKKSKDRPALHGMRKIRYSNYSEMYYSQYYSRIRRGSYDCSLTGYCLDDVLLKPFVKLWEDEKQQNLTLQELLDDAINSFLQSVIQDCEYQESEEYIADFFEANEFEFSEDGEMI